MRTMRFHANSCFPYQCASLAQTANRLSFCLIPRRHYNDPGAEVLEKKRIELKRELQKLDQHEHPHNRRRPYKSPCSSHGSCSSSGSGSESGSGSYTGSSGSSCSSSSCSSFSEDEVSHKKSGQPVRTKSYVVDKSTVAQQQLKASKRNQPQTAYPPQQQLNSSIGNVSYSKRLNSPQSTTSSYYSRKSARAGPLTPPLPSHHSLSNTPSSSTKLTTGENSSGVMKLDRHGNVRVSLHDKERQQQRRSAQPINSPASFGSQHNLSMNYSTKSSRSPMSRSREDLYSSFGSEEKKKFTPSPIHHPPPFHNQHRKQHGYYDDAYSGRSPNSPFFYNSNSKQSSAPNLRQTMQAHRSPADNYYLSPVNHRNVSPYGPPRTPPLPSHHPSQAMMNKPNKYGIDYDDPMKDPMSQIAGGAGWPMKRNFNSNLMQQQPFNPHHPLPHHPQQQQQQQQMNYSPLRTKSSLSNTHPHYGEPPFKKQQQSFPNFPTKQTTKQPLPNNQNAPIVNQNLKSVKQTVQPPTVKQVLAAKQPAAKLVDQVAVDEISSISNNSLEDMDAMNEEQKSLKAESVHSNKVDSGAVAAAATDAKETAKDEKDTKDAKPSPSKESSITDKAATDAAPSAESDAKPSDERPNDDAAGGKMNKDEEQDRFSEGNFSEWSDIDEYYSKTLNNQINVVEDSVSIPGAVMANKLPAAGRHAKSPDNDDDLKFKIDEELDEISDTEFDGIIDEQHLENEKNGMLSCKQVLDQLDINWASLIRDSEDEDRKQSISTSTDVLSRFKSARLLSQIGISSKHSGDELRGLIRNFCCTQLNDENFNFESPLAIVHSSRRKAKSDQPLANSNLPAEANDVAKLLSNGERPRKILSYNQLVQELRRKQEQRNAVKSAETSEPDPGKAGA